MIFLELIELTLGVTETSHDVSPTVADVSFYKKHVVDAYFTFTRAQIFNGLWHGLRLGSRSSAL